MTPLQKKLFNFFQREKVELSLIARHDLGEPSIESCEIHLEDLGTSKAIHGVAKILRL